MKAMQDERFPPKEAEMQHSCREPESQKFFLFFSPIPCSESQIGFSIKDAIFL